MGEDKKEKLSYEQLNDVCSQLSQQNKMLVDQINQLRQVDFYKGIDYFFKIVENSDKFTPEYVTNIVAKIEALIESKHNNNFMSLIAPSNLDATPTNANVRCVRDIKE